MFEPNFDGILRKCSDRGRLRSGVWRSNRQAESHGTRRPEERLLRKYIVSLERSMRFVVYSNVSQTLVPGAEPAVYFAARETDHHTGADYSSPFSRSRSRREARRASG